MADCRLCGRDIRWVECQGERIAIDARGTSQGGEGRYMEVSPGSNIVEPVSPTADVAALVDHRNTCPYGNLNVGGRGESARKSRERSPGGA